MEKVDVYVSAGRNRETGMVFWCAKMTYGPHLKRTNGTFNDEITTTAGGIIAGVNSMISALTRSVKVEIHAGNETQQKEISAVLSRIEEHRKNGMKSKNRPTPNTTAWNSYYEMVKSHKLSSISFSPSDGSLDSLETDGMLESYRLAKDITPSVSLSPTPSL